jgi:hypothetical protein
MTNVEARNNYEIRMTKVVFSSLGHSPFVLRHYIRPVFSSSLRINFIFRRTLGLSRNCEMVFGKRRAQFVIAAVPGTLKRSLRASRSVIITIAIHELLLNSARIIVG